MSSSETIKTEILSYVRDGKDLNVLLEKDDAYAFALSDCIKEGSVTGLSCSTNANGVPVFQKLDNYGLTDKGSYILSNS